MSLSLQSILGAEALAAFDAPGPVARGLPAAAYTSEAFLALEYERVFAPLLGLRRPRARAGQARRRGARQRGRPPRSAAARWRGRGPRLPQRLPPPLPQAGGRARQRRPGDPVPLPLVDLQARRRAPRRPLLRRQRPARGARRLRARGARAAAGAHRNLARLGLRQPERRRAADRGLRRPAPEAPGRLRPLPHDGTSSRWTWARSRRTGSS